MRIPFSFSNNQCISCLLAKLFKITSIMLLTEIGCFRLALAKPIE